MASATPLVPRPPQPTIPIDSFSLSSPRKAWGRTICRPAAVAAAEPAEPYALGDLVLDYGERKVTLAGRAVHLVPLEYRMLAELSASSGRVVTYEHLLERGWGEKSSGDLRPMRTIVNKLRRKLGEGADSPTYIFTEPRVGYRMAKGRTSTENPPATP